MGDKEVWTLSPILPSSQSKSVHQTKVPACPRAQLSNSLPCPLTSDLWATLIVCLCLHHKHLRCRDWNATVCAPCCPIKTAYLHYHRCCLWPSLHTHNHPPDTCLPSLIPQCPTTAESWPPGYCGTSTNTPNPERPITAPPTPLAGEE